jgi:hypothetical protein
MFPELPEFMSFPSEVVGPGPILFLNAAVGGHWPVGIQFS